MTETLATPAPPLRRTQADRRAESGRGLVRAAIEVTAEQGVSAATFENIGRQGGYSRSLVTRRFGSKRGLIDAVILYLHDHRTALAIEHGVDRLPGLEALLADTDLYLRSLSTQGELRAYFMLLASAVADLSDVRAAFAAAHEQVRERLRDFVRRGQAEGGVRPDLDADAAALMVGSLQLGLSLQMIVDPTMDLDPIRETSLATLRLSFEARR